MNQLIRLVLIVLMVAFFRPATAAMCLHPQMLAQSLAALHEAPSIQGVTANGWLMQVWRTKQSETWTVVMVSPDGFRACPLAAGTDLMEMDWRDPKEKDG